MTLNGVGRSVDRRSVTATLDYLLKQKQMLRLTNGQSLVLYWTCYGARVQFQGPTQQILHWRLGVSEHLSVAESLRVTTRRQSSP